MRPARRRAGSGRVRRTRTSSPSILTSWLTTSSSPRVQRPSDTRKRQLCHSQVSSSPSRSPGREAVALVRAGVVEREDAVAGPHHAQAVAVDPGQPERADREVRQAEPPFQKPSLAIMCLIDGRVNQVCDPESSSASITATPAPLTEAKRRIVDRLKRVDDATAAELASGLGLTGAAIRQHLDALAANGLVVARPRPVQGRGRPASAWALTDLARELFPDRHADLTVELIGSLRRALGPEGLDAVIAERSRAQIAAYRAALPAPSAPLLRAGRGAGARCAPARVTSPRWSMRRTATACCSSSTTARSATPPRPARTCARPSSTCSATCSGLTSR